MRSIILICLLALFSLGVGGCFVHDDAHDGDHHDDWAAHHDDHPDVDHHDVVTDHP